MVCSGKRGLIAESLSPLVISLRIDGVREARAQTGASLLAPKVSQAAAAAAAAGCWETRPAWLAACRLLARLAALCSTCIGSVSRRNDRRGFRGLYPPRCYGDDVQGDSKASMFADLSIRRDANNKIGIQVFRKFESWRTKGWTVEGGEAEELGIGICGGILRGVLRMLFRLEGVVMNSWGFAE